MENWKFGRWIATIVLLYLVGCGTPEVIAPTIAPSQTPTAPTPATLIPTATIVPTLPPPSTFTPAPTQSLPTATSVPTAEPATATPIAAPTGAVELTVEAVPLAENQCLPRAAVAAMQAPFRVTGADWPRPPAWQNEVFAGRGANNLIHLGFDVEGNPEPIAELLDVLDSHNVKTTMFILGSWADNNPTWIEEFVQRGHELANHTYTHGNMKEMDAATVQDELNHVEAIVQRLTGKTTKPWLRPPFGSRSDVSLAAAYDAGWTTVIWSGSPEDWRPEFDEDAMCRTLLESSYAGGILYAHTGRPEMPAVIDRFIGTMQQRGFTFVPLTVLLSENPAAYLVEE
jgi:peptidoglycan/xylan/chitin deacetylase (PgdA/CDA1 family)